jgi:hypothetical protein
MADIDGEPARKHVMPKPWPNKGALAGLGGGHEHGISRRTRGERDAANALRRAAFRPNLRNVVQFQALDFPAVRSFLSAFTQCR